MVLSNIDLHRSGNNSSSNTLKVRDLDKSLFIETLDFISESDKYFNDMLKDLHIKVDLSESSNLTFLNEFSITELIGSVISAFVTIITKIFEAFKNLFNRIFKTDNGIKQYETQLKSFTGEFNLSFERYNYTISDDIPRINLDTAFIDIYDELVDDFKCLKDVKTNEERISKLNMIEAKVNSDLGNTRYDRIRAKALNKPYAYLSADDYATVLFNTFRDGGALLTSKVTSQDITVIYDRYMCYKDTLKSTERLKSSTIKSAKDVEKKVKGLRLASFSTDYHRTNSDDDQAIFQRILSAVVGDIDTIAKIYEMAFSAKCDAIKESAKQDRQALIEAIKYIQANII